MHVKPGFVRVFSRYFHDNVLWLVAAPYRYFHDGAQKIPGFDLTQGTLYSPDTETYSAY